MLSTMQILWILGFLTIGNSTNDTAHVVSRMFINKILGQVQTDIRIGNDLTGVTNDFYVPYNKELNQMIKKSRQLNISQWNEDDEYLFDGIQYVQYNLENKGITSLDGAYFPDDAICIDLNYNKLKEITHKVRFPPWLDTLMLDWNPIQTFDLSQLKVRQVIMRRINISSFEGVRWPRFDSDSTFILHSRLSIPTVYNVRFPQVDYLYIDKNGIETLKNVNFRIGVDLDLSGNPISKMENVKIMCHGTYNRIEINAEDGINIVQDSLQDINFEVISNSTEPWHNVWLYLKDHGFESLAKFKIPDGVSYLVLDGNPIHEMPSNYPNSLRSIWFDPHRTNLSVTEIQKIPSSIYILGIERPAKLPAKASEATCVDCNIQ
eukprot:772895_1